MRGTEILAAYRETGSVWKAGQKLGIAGQTVARYLKRAGIEANGNGQPWAKGDDETLAREYRVHRDAGKLDALAKRMGRTKPFVCRQARRLGLTDQHATKVYASTWKYMAEDVAAAVFERFKASRLGLGKFCQRHAYDDVGFARTMRKFFPDEYEHIIEAKVPRQSMYRVGRAFEYRTRDHLKALGYIVLRSAGSKSVVDLVAVARGQVLLLQCKRGGDLPIAEWNELFRLASACGATPLLARIPAAQRGVEFLRLMAEKDGSRRTQPMESFRPRTDRTGELAWDDGWKPSEPPSAGKDLTAGPA